MKNLFIGDSITSGENNHGISYTDYIPFSEKIGISGTTIGEYSLYPVDGKSLLSIIPQNIDKIKEAENIFLEYGINDVSSISVGNVRPTQVLIAFNKAMDWIKQINPEANLYFLIGYKCLLSLALHNYKYLRCDYMKYYWDKDCIDAKDWANVYVEFLNKVVSPRDDIKIIDMYKNDKEYRDNLDEDDLHPNDNGYRIIANNIQEEIYNGSSIDYRN